VQGLTEFLPVSSSGHLVLAQAVLGVRIEGIFLEVVLHFATTLVVVLFYKDAVLRLLDPRAGGDTNRYRLALLIGVVPAVLFGLLLKEPMERLFESTGSTLVQLFVNGLMLLATRYAPAPRRGIGYGSAFLIGIGQALAIIPAISRSGATIATALFLRIRRKEAAEFSFLVSVPAILGAALLEAREIEAGASGMLLPAIAGMVVAAGSGYLALRFLVRVVEEGKLHRFGWYCLALAVAGGIALRVVSG
jgi:undecaprenyl-diphosphatase